MSAVIAEDLSKKFRIPKEKRTTLFQNLIGVIKRQLEYEEFWALRDISFTIEEGETFGIIGRNGSGKSTLLKILARVMYPDAGAVSVNGKVASFLELGIGFQPELTARENVYIYGSILGMSRKEVDRKYEAIFEFAELKRFQDMKLKNFSSGMYARLAFATAVHTEPEVLLVDEVFAVGDESFQKKSAEKMRELTRACKTVVFVSHNLKTVQELCRRCLLLDGGRTVSLGATEKVVADYLSLLQNTA